LRIFGDNIKKLLPINLEEIRDVCLRKKGAEEGFPFGNQTLVFKVGGKLFLLLSLDAAPIQFNVKCQPDKAIALREKYSNVLPGYHMNKRHWNTVICDHSVSKRLIFEWIEDSYKLVLHSLSKKQRSIFGL
jgi:predicted DNA-binding protein (MmcQ/YjbR family)